MYNCTWYEKKNTKITTCSLLEPEEETRRVAVCSARLINYIVWQSLLNRSKVWAVRSWLWVSVAGSALFLEQPKKVADLLLVFFPTLLQTLNPEVTEILGECVPGTEALKWCIAYSEIVMNKNRKLKPYFNKNQYRYLEMIRRNKFRIWAETKFYGQLYSMALTKDL